MSRQPPHDDIAEQGVLSSLLQFSEQSMPLVSTILQPSDFYNQRHSLIYEAMLWLYNQNTPVDEITVVSRLNDTGFLGKAGDPDFIVKLTELAVTPANVEHYANLVKNKSYLRAFVLAASQAIEHAYQEPENPLQNLEEAERAIFASSQQRYSQKTSSMMEVMERAVTMVNNRVRNKGFLLGVPTGFNKLDQITNGLQPSDLIIIAGRPSMGKTAFALNVGLNAAKEGGVTVAVFSLEMSKEQLGLRLLSSEARIPASKLRSGFVSENEFSGMVNAANTLSSMPLYIDDTPAISILELRAKARRLKMQYNLGLIIIDYLQLMRGRRDNFDSREQEISDISRSLKALARELNLPVVALSQLNRKVEDRPGGNKRPQLSDLRESGAIEQDADVIAFIYRDFVYNKEANEGEAEIIIGKQRNGPTGIIRLAFLKDLTSFANLTYEEEY
jgi:replicative DNA helicase